MALLFMVLAGCMDTDDPANDASPDPGGGEPATSQSPGEEPGSSDNDKSERGDTRVNEVVYKFEELLMGATPGNTQVAPVSDALPPTHEGTFSLGDNVTKLTFALGWDTNGIWTGTGSGRVMVDDPTGSQVFTSETFNCVGVPEIATVCAVEPTEEKTGPYPAGEYTVTYYVAGAMEANLRVTATYITAGA